MRNPRFPRAQAIAIPRPRAAVYDEWLMGVLVIALLLAGLLLP